MNPTDETYKTLDLAYEFFNKELFEGKLPNCLITMQRKGKARGFFSPERFTTRKAENSFIHEIALNPAHFVDRSDEDIVSTLVHEMAHLWQQEHGNPPRKNYHNREWAEKMESFGLIPSNTGEEGGAKTGQSMTHYIEKNGKYDLLIKRFFANNEPLHYQDRPEAVGIALKKKNKIKYNCPKCGLNAWGKPGANLICGDDNVKMEESI